MSTLVLRTVKGSPLTSAEIDANVINLNTDKADKASPTFTGAVTLPNSLLQVTASSYPTIQPTLNLDFANTKLLDPRITFVRNATATYYDGQTTALAEQNLLLQSNFQSGWTAFNGTLTANVVVAPDGTTTASTWVQTASDAQLYQPVANSTLVPYTLSVYVSVPSGTLPFKLRIGTATALSSSILTATTTWQRFTFTVTPTTAITSVVIDTDGTNFGTLNLAFSQLEQRSSVTAYTKTTTSAITNYIPVLMTAPAGVARFDCDPITGKSLGLLIEESRTNLLTYSSDFSNAVWTKTAVTITSAANVAPDGTLTAQRLVEDTATSAHALGIQVGTVGNTETWSCYAKPSGRNWLYMQCGPTSVYCNFDISNGVVGSAAGILSSNITPVGNNWYRCVISFVRATNSNNFLFSSTTNSTTQPSYTGNGYSGIYIWGAQLEAGSFATSYIPTVASTVTRAADNASMTGTNFSSWYNQSQGSIYAEYAAKGIVNYAGIFEITDTYTWNRGLSLANNTTDTAVYYGTGSATLAVTSLPDPVVNVINKAVVTYTNTSIGLCLNSVNLSSTTVPNSPFYGSLFIGKQTVTGADQTVSGHIRKISYYPVALSSSNLVALTS